MPVWIRNSLAWARSNRSGRSCERKRAAKARSLVAVRTTGSCAPVLACSLPAPAARGRVSARSTPCRRTGRQLLTDLYRSDNHLAHPHTLTARLLFRGRELGAVPLHRQSVARSPFPRLAPALVVLSPSQSHGGRLSGLLSS